MGYSHVIRGERYDFADLRVLMPTGTLSPTSARPVLTFPIQ
jgi:hypothetical protein